MEILTVLVALFIFCKILIPLFNLAVIEHKNKQLRKNVSKGTFISAEEFESNWITHKQGHRGVAGYKYTDGPGCYVITIYDSVPCNGFMSYDDIYIGQSVNMCQRVHNHLNGKGNGDVYADFNMGATSIFTSNHVPEKI